VQELNLGEQLAAALLRREGELGILLDLAESLEHPDPRRTLDALQAAAGLTLLDTAQAEIEAMAWTHQLVDNTYTN